MGDWNAAVERDLAAQLAPSRERLLARVLPAAELLPGIVARRDARGTETLLARKSSRELQAMVVILASWLAEAEAAAREGEAA